MYLSIYLSISLSICMLIDPEYLSIFSDCCEICMFFLKGYLIHIFPLEIVCCLYEIVCSIYIAIKYFRKKIDLKHHFKVNCVKDKTSVK